MCEDGIFCPYTPTALEAQERGLKMNFNTVTLAGRLAAAPMWTKGKKEDGSDDRCWARLAVNRPTKDKAVDFFPICAWGARARVLAKFGKKGKIILVHGTLRTTSKLRPDGTRDNYTEVSVGEIILGEDAKGAPAQSVVAALAVAPPVIPALTPEMVEAFAKALAAQKAA